MKKKIQYRVLLLLFSMCLLAQPMTAYADPETSTEENGEAVTDEAETEEESLSSDCSLSSLKIAQGTLNPEFSSEQLTYSITVPGDVERVALTAQTSDANARKVIRGTGDLKAGENTVTVTVTAEDGTVREYRITVIRETLEETTEGDSETSEAQTEPTESQTEPVESQTEDTETENSAGESSVTDENTEENTGEHTDPAEETTTEEYVAPLETISRDTNKNSGGFNLFSGSGLKKVMVVLIIACVGLLAAIIALLLKNRNEDEEEIEEETEKEAGEDKVSEREEFAEEETAEIKEVYDSSDDLDEIIDFDEEDESDTETDMNGKAGSEDIGDIVPDTDSELDNDFELDDDFDLLLEDDDDFDFLNL